MEKPAPKVMKSKSSNITVYTKKDKNNKKSRSNAEFQPNVQRKRGMYVEKKIMKTGITDPVKSPPKQKAPPRPRPGSKRFLTSVLTILSKSTTGTQHPELDITQLSKPKTNPDTTIDKRPKRKFKSRILNNQDEKLIVLQSTRHIINTPSIYSERSQETMKTTLSRFGRSELQQEINKPIDADVKKGKKDKKVTIDEPVTLVQDKRDPTLYNFFVDLLQTTFSVSNMNTLNSKTKKPCNSKIDLSINESVTKKLNDIKEIESTPITDKAPKMCCLADENWSDINLRNLTPPPIRYSKIHLLPKRTYVKHKTTESLNTKLIIPKAYSGLFTSKKSYRAKSKKKIILNLLKRELQMEGDPFLEPQNLYQALRNIARNKRKYQKTLHFTKGESSDECIFKLKKIISSTKARKRIDKDSKSVRTDYTNNYSKRHVKDYSSEESHHTLEVFDYDYEVDQKRVKDIDLYD